MKDSLLIQIQDDVVKYANIIANVIKADVEIVDQNLFRVAGTGIYKDHVNKDISKEGYVYSQIMKNGEKQVIKTPGEHFLCKNCVHKHCCIEKMLIGTPILLNAERIGVIGIVCSTEEQRDYVADNLDVYIQILEQIADFISSKAYQHMESERNYMMLELLNQIIDSVDKGVLVISENEIVQMNAGAMKKLRLSKGSIGQRVMIASDKEYAPGVETYNLTINNRKFNLMGRLIPVFPVISAYDHIFIFEETSQNKNVFKQIRSPKTVVRIDDIIGNSKQMTRVKQGISRIASSVSTVLVTGESGTGKELIARAIHYESSRSDRPFIAINCGAIPENLLESELFGYVRGAFSGADPNGKVGKFELANKGTIFLDEIGDMPLYLQVKLLRVLQERKLVRIGSNQLIDLDIRVIAATNKDLKKLIGENGFREDLYYRLNVIPMDIPPLRNRKDDIHEIAGQFISKYNIILKRSVNGMDDEVNRVFESHPWPGNVRELENAVEYMMNMAGTKKSLSVDMLPFGMASGAYENEVEEPDGTAIRSLKDVEREHIINALKICGDDTKGKQLAAKKLGIGIATLYRKMGIKKQ